MVIDDARRKHTRKSKRGGYTVSVKQQRQRTADALAQLDPTEPRALSLPHVAGVLVRRGYMRKKGKGLYVRTAKAFTV